MVSEAVTQEPWNRWLSEEEAERLFLETIRKVPTKMYLCDGRWLEVSLHDLYAPAAIGPMSVALAQATNSLAKKQLVAAHPESDRHILVSRTLGIYVRQ